MSHWLVAAFLSIASEASRDLFQKMDSPTEIDDGLASIDVANTPEWLRLKSADQTLLRQAFYILKKMDAVYLTESLDTQIKPLLRLLKVEQQMQNKNVSGKHLPKRLTLNEKLSDRLIRDNPVDMALYRLVKLRRICDPIFS